MGDDPLDVALRLLGEVIEIRKIHPQHLVVCGGAALRALKIVSRTTRDVDVLAFCGNVDGEINMAWPLCDDLKAAVQRDEKRDGDDLLALAPTSAECAQFREFFTTEQQPKFREIVAALSHGE